MKAIATIAALLCSTTLSFAQGGAASPQKPSTGASSLAAPSTQRSQAAATPSAPNTPNAPKADASRQPEPLETAEEGMNLLSLLKKGGWAMIPLGGLSVITLMLIIGYTITLRHGAIASRQYVSTIEVLIRKKDYLGVLAVSNRHGEALARVVQRTLDFATKNPGAPFESLREVAEAEGSAQASSMLHRVAYLADIGILAPMVGLFGTVLGLIQSFSSIGKGSASLGRDVMLASGVSEALIATASGLVLAVLSAAFYAIFRNRAQALVSELEGVSSTFLGLMATSYQRRREPSRADDEF
jgi:biopolymer transport protein ExbB